MSVYKIPLKFRYGEFKFGELNAEGASEDSAVLELNYDDEYRLLTYNVPLHGGDVRIYSVPRECMPNALTAFYDKNGELIRAELDDNGRARLIYILAKNAAAPNGAVLKFVKEQADMIAAEIVKREQTLARLFIEKFYDGEAADIAVRTATAEEARSVADCDRDALTADNSGNYPVENRTALDSETLGVMLMCTGGGIRSMLFDRAAEVFAERLKSRVLKKIKMTADFKFICEDYD